MNERMFHCFHYEPRQFVAPFRWGGRKGDAHLYLLDANAAPVCRFLPDEKLPAGVYAPADTVKIGVRA